MLDASAVLAFINQESGAEAVEEYLNDAAISSVNLSEVVAKLIEKGSSELSVRALIEELKLEVIAVDEKQAIAAGILRRSTKSLGLSLGDRLCIVWGNTLINQLSQPTVNGRS